MSSPGDTPVRHGSGRLGGVLWVVVIVGVVAFISVPSPASAETTQSELVLIREGDVVSEDLYAVGQRIQIDGVVEGDLVAFGLDEIRINGRVTGSVIAAAASIVVSGEVGGSLRVVAESVVVEGNVAGDVLTATWRLNQPPAGSIGRDLIAAAWRTNLGGSVGGDIEGRYRTLSIDGSVAGQVVADASRTSVGSEAEITGDLAVRSGRPPTVADGATIGGDLVPRRPLSPNVRVTAIGLLLRVLAGIGATMAGLAMMWHDSTQAETMAQTVSKRRIAVAGYGGLAVGGPILFIVVLFGVMALLPSAAALPLLLFTIPVTFGIVTMLLLASLFAPLGPAVRLGSVVIPRRSVFARFLAGMAVVTVGSFLPIVGPLLVLLVVVAGFGAWLAAPRPQPV